MITIRLDDVLGSGHRDRGLAGRSPLERGVRPGAWAKPFFVRGLGRFVASSDAAPSPFLRRVWVSLFVALALASVSTIASVVAGDGSPSGITNANGYYLLTPAGTFNYTLHAYLADLGLPVSKGDTLIYSWRANNGSGPPIYFEIHAHPITGGYFAYYNTTATSINSGSWTAPKQDRYMVYWVNLNNRTTVNLTYSFVLIFAQTDLWVLYIAPFAMAGIGAVAVVAHILARRRRPPS